MLYLNTASVKLQEKLEKESESAKADGAGTSSGAAATLSSAAREEPDVNQDHLRQASRCILSLPCVSPCNAVVYSEVGHTSVVWWYIWMQQPGCSSLLTTSSELSVLSGILSVKRNVELECKYVMLYDGTMNN